jgi:hypothetical protein
MKNEECAKNTEEGVKTLDLMSPHITIIHQLIFEAFCNEDSF